MNAKLNRRERKAQQLLAHYSRCEALARLLGHPKPDGKVISVNLCKAERIAHQAAEQWSNGEIDHDTFEVIGLHARNAVLLTFNNTKIPGLFVSSDPFSHAVKIDNESPLAAELSALSFVTDSEGNFILSPDIDGSAL